VLIAQTYSQHPERPCSGRSFRYRSMLRGIHAACIPASAPLKSDSQSPLLPERPQTFPHRMRMPRFSQASKHGIRSISASGLRTHSPNIKPPQFQKHCRSSLFRCLYTEVKLLLFVPLWRYTSVLASQAARIPPEGAG